MVRPYDSGATGLTEKANSAAVTLQGDAYLFLVPHARSATIDLQRGERRRRIGGGIGSAVPAVNATVVAPAGVSLATGGPGSVSPTPARALSFSNRSILVDGVAINAGTAVQGLPMNNRLVQGIADFSGEISWDADANTQAFIDALPAYRSYGINMVTVNFQGGLAQSIGSITWGSSESSYNNSAWNANGSIKSAYADRATDLLDACIANEIIPVMGLFYFRQDNHLSNETAVIAAVDAAMTFLEPWKSQIIVEVANECDSAQYNHAILRPTRIRELIERLQDGGFYATTSFQGSTTPPFSTMETADVILLHGNDRTTSQITQQANDTLNRFPGKPVFYNEDGPTNRSYDPGEWMAHFDAAVNAGCGWGYYSQSEYQNAVSPHINWDVDRTDTLTFHNKVATFTEQSSGSGAWLEADGKVIIEVESEQAVGHWSSTTAASGFSGASYYRWVGPNRFSNPGSDSTLEYLFKINTAATYRFYVHSYRHGTGASDEHNDVWMQLDNGPWEKLWQRGNTHGVWEWRHRIEREVGGVVEPNNEPDFALTAGYHTLRFTGRSTDFSIDKIHVYTPNTEAANPPLAEPISDREESIVVDEPFPANPDVILSPGQAVQQHLTSGRTVELQGGFYGDQQLSPASGVYLFCRTQATFQAPQYGQKRFLDTGGNNVTLRGLKIDRYGTATAHSDAALMLPSGSSGWTLMDIEIMRAVSSSLTFRGSGHEVIRPVLHDFGRYGWTNGTNDTIRDAHVYRGCINDGTQLVPLASGSDRGVCKMAGGSSGVFVDGLLIEDIQEGKGLWWDGARDGSARNVRAYRVSHNAISIEVCWGGAQNAPSGKTTTWPDPAFDISGVYIEDQQQEYEPNDFWPAPSAISVSMSPGVWIDNFEVNGAGTAGISVLYSSGHPVFAQGYPAQNISASWTQANLKNHNVRFEDFVLRGPTKRYQVGVVGGFDGAVGSVNSPVFASGGPATTTYAMTPSDRFRWEGNSNMTRSQWLALGHS